MIIFIEFTNEKMAGIFFGEHVGEHNFEQILDGVSAAIEQWSSIRRYIVYRHSTNIFKIIKKPLKIGLLHTS